MRNAVEVLWRTYHTQRLAVLAFCFLSAMPCAASVTGWGRNDSGTLIIPSTVSNVIAIASGRYHNVVLNRDGTVIAWGYNNVGQTNVPPNATNVTSIACGSYHSAAFVSN